MQKQYLKRMRVLRGWLLAAACFATGCTSAGDSYTVPEQPLPPNTIMLSQMMRELSDRPGFTEALLAQLNQGTRKGPALLTPALVDRMRALILGKDWQGLDRFPGWTMREINPTVRVVGHVVGKDEAAEGLAARHPGAAPGTVERPAASESVDPMRSFIDVGRESLQKAETINLDEPSKLPGFTTEGLLSNLGAGVIRGDGPNAELAPLHAESERLAETMNRLSLNGVTGYAPAEVTIFRHIATTPQGLVQVLMETGHTVEVLDARYFANFGHLHYKGQDVMMPFWVNSQILVPGTNRPLLVPVSHAEYEWRVRGPRINAEMSWYFGIDGKAEFRTMDTQDQPWVKGRHAHTYGGADAVEVTRLAGKMTVAYLHQHRSRPALPFGGYYALGVCQDGVAAIEKKMTGTATLFPNTADAQLFDDARDAEVNDLIAAIPKDRAGRPPEPERIFGSLPVDDGDLKAIMIPGLAGDLLEVRTAWRDGQLERTHGRNHVTVLWLEGLGAVLALVAVLLLHRRRQAL